MSGSGIRTKAERPSRASRPWLGLIRDIYTIPAPGYLWKTCQDFPRNTVSLALEDTGSRRSCSASLPYTHSSVRRLVVGGCQSKVTAPKSYPKHRFDSTSGHTVLRELFWMWLGAVVSQYDPSGGVQQVDIDASGEFSGNGSACSGPIKRGKSHHALSSSPSFVTILRIFDDHKSFASRTAIVVCVHDQYTLPIYFTSSPDFESFTVDRRPCYFYLMWDRTEIRGRPGTGTNMALSSSTSSTP